METIASMQWRSTEDRRNLLVSFASSILLHGLGLTLWVLAATAMVALNQALLTDLKRASEEARRRAEERVPTVFVEVNPEDATAEPPRDTANYSTLNSRAANPDATQDTGVPKIEGSQDQMLRTADVLRPQPQPLQPALPAPEPVLDPTPTQPITPGAGDLAVGSTEPKPQDASTAPSRPRTLVEARMRQGILAGRKSRQDGGVRNRGRIALDAKASAYGAYDQALIEAIQSRWYQLLDDSSIPLRPGRVVVNFTLHYDGRITDLQSVQSDVGEIPSQYCLKAISDPAPFARWPAEMRQMVGSDVREVTITFFYL